MYSKFLETYTQRTSMFILLACFLIIIWLMTTPGSMMEVWGSNSLGFGMKILWLGSMLVLPILGSVAWIVNG